MYSSPFPSPQRPDVARSLTGTRKRMPSFQAHADVFARKMAGVGPGSPGETKRTEVIDSAPENFELQTAEYVGRAWDAPSMTWFRQHLAGRAENLRRRMVHSGPASQTGAGSSAGSEGPAGSEGVKAYLKIYIDAVVDPVDVPPALVAKLGRASAAARESVVAVLADRPQDAGREQAAARKEMAGLLTAPVWPWRVAVVDGVVEGGFPHTVHDVIVLPLAVLGAKTVDDLASLLTHEATHVFQRMRPKRAAAILERDFGFVPAGPSDAVPLTYEIRGTVRLNPDTDALRWASTKRGGETLLPVPVFAEGKGFRDVKLMYGAEGSGDAAEGAEGALQLPAEHPKEVMAYAWQNWAKKRRVTGFPRMR